MTPKEKAKQLLWKYLPILEGWTDDGKTQLAKECALIAVDEVYKLNLKLGQHLEEDEDKINYYSYWEQVKEEIEKL